MAINIPSLLADLEYWREPTTGAVSCEYLPKDYSCDNAVAFTAELVALTETGGPVPFFDYMLLQYEKSPGVLLRHPTATELCSWDDHLAAAATSPWMAGRILAHGRAAGWHWGDKWLGRFPIFIPTVKAKAGENLNLINKLMTALAFIANSFEGHEHTSGKLSLWLASKALYGAPMRGFNWAISLWRWAQMKRYPGGLREVMGIYFPPKMPESGYTSVPHPFSIYSPESFD